MSSPGDEGALLDKLLPTGSEEREVLAVGSIPAAILLSCQNVRNVALLLHKHAYSWVVKVRTSARQYLGHNTYTALGHHTERGPMGLDQYKYNSLGAYCGPHTASSVFLILLLCRPTQHQRSSWVWRTQYNLSNSALKFIL